MSTVTEHIDVAVPVRTAYDQWTQFEDFPSFMEGVSEVRQLDDTHLRWTTKIAGVEREFDAEITEQHPDQRIAWRATSGTRHAGAVTFQRLDDESTRVTVQMDTEPEGVAETVGDKLGILKRRVKGDLDRFKDLIERRGAATGAWRGEVGIADDDVGPAPRRESIGGTGLADAPERVGGGRFTRPEDAGQEAPATGGGELGGAGTPLPQRAQGGL